jgi:DNA polymerase I-like protein with 3'-5' exonuclease and polymerase domains
MQVPYNVVAFVHDEIVLEVLTKEAKKWGKILSECMTEAIVRLAPDVCHKHAVDVYIGKTWAAKK